MEEMGGQCRGGEVCETRIAGETRSSRAPTPSAAHVCASAPQCRLVCRLGSALVCTRRAGGHSSTGEQLRRAAPLFARRWSSAQLNAAPRLRPDSQFRTRGTPRLRLNEMMFTILHCTFEYFAGRQCSQSKTHRAGLSGSRAQRATAACSSGLAELRFDWRPVA